MNSLKMKSLLGFFCFFAFTVLAGDKIFAESPVTDKPNVLILLADNWAYPHASILGDKSVKTPTFDRLAREGVLFTHAFCQVPSCSAARAVLLTGQATHRLQQAANLWGDFPSDLTTYTSLLQKAGYQTGYAIKGWGPGRFRGERHTKLNPCGAKFKSFKEFLDKTEKGQPFCFWFGSHDPHQPWDQGTDFIQDLDSTKVHVPKYLPDHPVVRNTIVDYYTEVQRFDSDCRLILDLLKKSKLDENTIVIVLGDNGWQMPRGLANVYDAGTRVPMAIRWPAKINNVKVCDELISFEDVAPTILQACGLEVPRQMTGQSLMPLLVTENQKAKGQGTQEYPWRDVIFLERERHANVRKGDLTYPIRAARTKQFLYVRNLFPERWPAGDPRVHWAVGDFGDVDNTPVKALLLDNRNQADFKPFFDLGFGKRPKEELYDLAKDPDQIRNVIANKNYAEELEKV